MSFNKHNESLEIRCQLEGWHTDKIAVAAIVRDGQIISFAEPMTMTPVSTGIYVEPFVRLNRDQAQVLMDDLWQCGLRPSEGAGSAGAMAAVQRHLEDMRTLVFKK